VFIDADSETHFFCRRPAALAKACRWAGAQRPRLVLLSNIAGHIERHREYLATPDPVVAA
jgi:hypothetical protein